jgi:hypothetical protein
VLRGRNAVRIAAERVLVRLPKAPADLARPDFVTCASADVRVGGRRYRAGVLVNGHDSDEPATLLPALAREPRGVAVTSGGSSVRRAGRAWVVVSGAGSAAADRAAVLRGLRLTLR